MRKLDGHLGKIRALAFSPDGRRLASAAGREKWPSLWDVAGGRRTIAPGNAEEVQALAFAPDSSHVVIASGRYLRKWDPEAKTVTERWLRGANHVWQVAYSPDGSTLAATCYQREGAADCYRVNVFRPAESAEKMFLAGDYGPPYCLAFSADGRFLVAGGADKKVRVWSMKEKAKAVAWDCGGLVHAVALSPDGALAAVAAGKTLAVYSPGNVIARALLDGHKGAVNSLSFAPDGTLLSGGEDGTVRLWDVSSGRERTCFDWQIGKVRVATFSPDGTLAAAGGENGLVVWDVD
jgi:WD40 repeat protein